MNKYLTIMKIAAKQQWASRTAVCMRLFFLGVLLFVFGRLWLVLRGEYHDVLNPANFVWYLLITETIYFSRSEQIHSDIAEDVRSSNIAYALIRPASYFNTKIAENMGGTLVRLPLILGIGILMALVFSGGLPDAVRALPVIFMLIPFAVLFSVIIYIAVGLFAFIIQDSSPVYWIVTKLDFVFGGLFFPLIIYPEWMQAIAFKTPFAWTTYGIGRLIYDFSWHNVLETLGGIIAWTAVFYLLTIVLFRFVASRLQVNGG